ncbi:response regulator [Phenylobacterium hankyongense]|uniref:Response regulator n=1 Tax=Phenylobacterium hankyongense TaxID=1813876 RepID=A0A328B4Z4_9CAUL|nr:response regulator [Phenylobacterium hankyongense]RAK60996.1 response regulator [Phenylobacterium hankyongense]
MTYKILIVDDSKLARMAVARALNNLRPDWVRVEAGDAAEALALIRQGGLDLVLLDFNMPGVDGLSLAADLQQTRPGMPVALISANVQREVMARAAEAGAHFLSKPLSETALDAFLMDAEGRLTAGMT